MVWEHHVIGPIQTNCFVFGRPENAIMVDPGGPEAEDIAKKLLDNEIEIKHVLVTHGHFDHLGWAPNVQKLVEGSKVYLHEAEKPAFEPFLRRMPKMMGIPDLELREPDVWLSTDQILDLGDVKFKIVHTPGHSPGSIVYEYLLPNSEHKYFSNESYFVGDLIFQGSIGRFDLPFSNGKEMKESLLKIMDLIPPISDLYPGHGNLTTMKAELERNTYLIALKNGIDLF